MSLNSEVENKSLRLRLRRSVPRVKIVVPVEGIREFVDLEALATLVKASKDDELTAEERLAKERFLMAKDKFDSGIGPESPLEIMDDD